MNAISNSERFNIALDGIPGDRLPCVEWATRLSKTLDRWRLEGYDFTDDPMRADEYFGLDAMCQFWLPVSLVKQLPFTVKSHADYTELKKLLFNDKLLKQTECKIKESLKKYGERPIYWFTLDGFFWFPRKLFGIREHLLSFYDCPDLPLERTAGVDVNRIRKLYPELIMIGAFDKTVIHFGEAAMRSEFERLLPAMRGGRFIPSVDHQTPPDVSVENYMIYVRLLKEYAQRAVKEMNRWPFPLFGCPNTDTRSYSFHQ